MWAALLQGKFPNDWHKGFAQHCWECSSVSHFKHSLKARLCTLLVWWSSRQRWLLLQIRTGSPNPIRERRLQVSPKCSIQMIYSQTREETTPVLKLADLWMDSSTLFYSLSLHSTFVLFLCLLLTLTLSTFLDLVMYCLLSARLVRSWWLSKQTVVSVKRVNAAGTTSCCTSIVPWIGWNNSTTSDAVLLQQFIFLIL